MTKNPTLPPNPRGGWSQSVVQLKPALIAPPESSRGLILRTAVFDENGRPEPYAATWRRDVPITEVPDSPPRAGQRLDGQWLWGGVLYHQFGHFQVESIARLWALRRFRDEIMGILFVARDGNTQVLDYEKRYLELLGCDAPIRVCQVPTEVESLIVPGQGFGLGSIAGGTRVFRRFISEDFAKDIAPEGAPDLFISRSRQPLEKGGFIGEEVLDARMREAGYDVFWPEAHDLDTQIARYKAARRVVALDGSALHLLAMVARKTQKIALVLRRERIASRSLRRHLMRFSGVAPVTINALRGETEPVLGKKRSIDELDLAHVGRVLKRRGFLRKSHEWGPLQLEELARVSADHSA